MSVVYLLFTQDKNAYEGHTWLQVVWFGLPLGAGMALLASVGFLIKAAKARLIGPNPVFTPEAQLGIQPNGPASGGSAS